MKHLKMLGLAAVAAMALTAFTAGSASATTLEIGGVTQNTSVTIAASLKSGTSALLKDTFGFSINTCTSSTVTGATASPFSGATDTGPVTTLDFASCTRELVIVDKPGTLHIAFTKETNGTLTSSGAEVTTPSPLGILNCKTGEGTHLGTLTGVASGHATLDINAVLLCGISVRWEATYTVTNPTGLGVEN